MEEEQVCKEMMSYADADALSEELKAEVGGVLCLYLVALVGGITWYMGLFGEGV